MSLIIPIAGLLIAAFSVSLDLFPPSLASLICLHGGCRFDQVYAAINAAGATPQAVSILADADPANPLVWCTLAEVLSARGETHQAESAFDHAVSLGPGMSPVLMRAANYDFAHGRRDRAFPLSARILSQTSAFDEIVFSYVQASSPARTLLGTAIPATSRPARSWLNWLRTHGSDEDIYDTWTWMAQNRLLDERSAGEAAWTLWNRGSFEKTSALWTAWLGESGAGDSPRQLLANADFSSAPRESPLDWTLASLPSVAVTRANGLEVRFSGTENVAFSQVRQFTVATPGRYRFSAEVAAENLTTDQRPFFHIFDPANPNLLNVQTEIVDGTVARSRIGVEFTVVGKTEALAVQLERRPSQRFDNRISGTLHVYQVSLVRLPAQPK